MPIILPLFDPRAKCVKCGADVVSRAWHGNPSNFNRCETICSDLFRDKIEHMLRRCLPCDFSWLELPLDALERQRRATNDEWAAEMLDKHVSSTRSGEVVR